jgi:hypothetical protein
MFGGVIKNKICEGAKEIDSIIELKRNIKDIFRNDEGIQIAIRNFYRGMQTRMEEIQPRAKKLYRQFLKTFKIKLYM